MTAVAFTSAGLPLILACAGAVVSVTLVGLALERLTPAPLRQVPVTNLIIITIGGSIFLRGAARLTWAKDAPKARGRRFAPIPASSRRTSAPRRPLLTISGLSCRYGGIAALKGVHLAVREGELVTIIGPNGASKSTLLKAIMGVVDREAAVMTFDGPGIRAAEPLEIVRLGGALVREGRQVGPMTVEENLVLGTYRRSQRRFRAVSSRCSRSGVR